MLVNQSFGSRRRLTPNKLVSALLRNLFGQIDCAANVRESIFTGILWPSPIGDVSNSVAPGSTDLLDMFLDPNAIQRCQRCWLITRR